MLATALAVIVLGRLGVAGAQPAPGSGPAPSPVWPVDDNQAPVLLLGQGPLEADGDSNNIGKTSARTLHFPDDVLFDGRGLWVAEDSGRVLGWNQPPTTSEVPADRVLGAPSMTAQGTLGRDLRLTSDGKRLMVWSPTLRRLLVWNLPVAKDGAKPDVTLKLPPLDRDGDGEPDEDQRSDETLQPTRKGVCSDGQRLALILEGKLVVWNAFPRKLRRPDVTVATSVGDAVRVTCDQQRLAVVDHNGRRVLVWSTWPTKPTQGPDQILADPALLPHTSGRTLGLPLGALLDGERLWVADSGHGRVLLVPLPVPAGGAVRVLGQDSLFSSVSRKRFALRFPKAITRAGDILYVAAGSRVLGYRLDAPAAQRVRLPVERRSTVVLIDTLDEATVMKRVEGILLANALPRPRPATHLPGVGGTGKVRPLAICDSAAEAEHVRFALAGRFPGTRVVTLEVPIEAFCPDVGEHPAPPPEGGRLAGGTQVRPGDSELYWGVYLTPTEAVVRVERGAKVVAERRYAKRPSGGEIAVRAARQVAGWGFIGLYVPIAGVAVGGREVLPAWDGKAIIELPLETWAAKARPLERDAMIEQALAAWVAAQPR